MRVCVGTAIDIGYNYQESHSPYHCPCIGYPRNHPSFFCLPSRIFSSSNTTTSSHNNISHGPIIRHSNFADSVINTTIKQ